MEEQIVSQAACVLCDRVWIFLPCIMMNLYWTQMRCTLAISTETLDMYIPDEQSNFDTTSRLF